MTKSTDKNTVSSEQVEAALAAALTDKNKTATSKKDAKKPTEKKVESEEKNNDDDRAGGVDVAAKTMLGDLMKMSLDMAKALPMPWQKLSENQQISYLDSIEKQCREAVQKCVQLIASDGFTRIAVQIKSTTIKDGVEVKCELIDRHQVIDLVSAESMIAMLVLADSSQFTQGGELPKADPDQPVLPLDDAAKETAALNGDDNG